MRRVFLLLPCFLAGCSNAPLVGFLDAVAPSHVKPAAPPIPVDRLPPPVLDGAVTPRTNS